MPKTATRQCDACGLRNDVGVEQLLEGSTCRGCHGRLRPLSRPLPVDGPSLEAVVKAARIPVVVEVQLRGSSEERNQRSALEKVAEHLEGKVIITKLDAQEERELVLRLGISTVPAFVVFVGGQIAHTYEGSADAAVIEEWVWQLTH